mmetsp:Transcript_5231/g.14174  ORF Transcript_5231/g.14174 Transcript_5231/m.14174 type:complete len:512 (+) Transcript_5231:75-1610(+)
MALQLTPTQHKALDELLAVARLRTTPLVELRSPTSLGRGHGVTSVLRALAQACGAPLLGIATTVQAGSTEDGAAGRVIYEAALQSFEKYGVAIVDDLDLAAAPKSLRRSRTLVGTLKGSGDTYNWEVSSGPAMLLKALGDAAAASGRVLVFSTIEDAQLAFTQAPLSVTLGEPTAADYATVIRSRVGAKIDEVALMGKVAAQMAAAAPAAPAEMDTERMLTAVRTELVSTLAVAPEDVEAVDLAKFPGLEGIKEELEKHVLFPLENPERAARLGLAPKRGVLIHGQPGTGKTTVGRWLAHRMKGKFFRVGEMMLHADIIKVFAAAQAAAPAIVFIDDADIVIGGWRPLDGGRGSDIFRFLLGSMDGLTSRSGRHQNGDVIIMLTGQSVHWMAEMLLRSGRIELWLKTKLPDGRQKREILKKYITEDRGAMELLGENGAPPEAAVRTAAQISDHFCCADLRRIVNDAKILAAWDQAANKIADKKDKHHLEQAAENVKKMQDDVKENTRHMYG